MFSQSDIDRWIEDDRKRIASSLAPDFSFRERLSAQASSTFPTIPAPVTQKIYDKKSDPHTSYGRFHLRINTYRQAGKSVAIHHFWWFVHNSIAHPLIGILPIEATFRFHDFTSRKINLKNG